ncbi:YokU family protein [Neobacillus jeddahensis]|uniref:YokU family protein n=1 Tax=Neobacillus jeddahensis TaxID=1461580 RepID=UPI00058EB1E5|nr:YokU family protein [Neobacillus jeddahensis]
MKLVCEWCDKSNVEEIEASVYWELPDGTRAIEIIGTPTHRCPDCNMVYQSELLIKEIENQLFLIDCKQIETVITFAALMKMPKLLKRNYFDCSS